MNQETREWLEPMLAQLDDQPADEANRFIDELVTRATVSDGKPVYGQQCVVDWIKVGQLLRHELGWDGTYPDHPEGAGGSPCW